MGCRGRAVVVVTGEACDVTGVGAICWGMDRPGTTCLRAAVSTVEGCWAAMVCTIVWEVRDPSADTVANTGKSSTCRGSAGGGGGVCKRKKKKTLRTFKVSLQASSYLN